MSRSRSPGEWARGTWTVALREFLGFADQATAYILAVAFLGLGIFLGLRSIFALGGATLRPFFDLLPWLFAVFVPAVTMRSLAEERRSGTAEWLLAQPLDEIQIVTGKFVGNWLFVMATVAGSVFLALGLLMASDADPGIMVAQYAGAGLLAAQGVAVGLWASSLTRNQITAFIVAVAVSFGLVLIGLPVVQFGVPPLLGSALAELSVLQHFDSVTRGVIDLRDLIYFGSTAALFTGLATARVAAERLSHAGDAYRRLRWGAVGITLLVVIVNLLGSHIRGRLDLTEGDLYTLSPASEDLLEGLDDIVTLKLVISDELPPEVRPVVRDVRDLIADLRSAARGQLRVEEIDPSDDEDRQREARDLGISPIQFNVVRDDNYEVQRGWFGLALLYADEREVFPVIRDTHDLEFQLVSAIDAMTSEAKPRVVFLTDGGARAAGSFPELNQGLAQRLDMTSAAIGMDSVVAGLSPDTIDVLVVAAPSQPLDSLVVGEIERYLDAGGSAFLLVERNVMNPQSMTAVPTITGLERIVSSRGAEVGAEMVLDYASSLQVQAGQQGAFSLVRPYPLWPVARAASEHAVVGELTNISLGWASPLIVQDTSRVIPLWETSTSAATQPPGSLVLPEALPPPEEAGLSKYVLAAAIDPERPAAEGGENVVDDAPEGRLVVVGDVDFLESDFVRANPQNLAFAANALDWLAKDEALIRIRSKNRTPPFLVFETDGSRSLFRWGNLVGVPLLVAIFGFLRVTGRGRRARRRWEEVIPG